jgi:hypothetical protein
VTDTVTRTFARGNPQTQQELYSAYHKTFGGRKASADSEADDNNLDLDVVTPAAGQRRHEGQRRKPLPAASTSSSLEKPLSKDEFVRRFTEYTAGHLCSENPGADHNQVKFNVQVHRTIPTLKWPWRRSSDSTPSISSSSPRDSQILEEDDAMNTRPACCFDSISELSYDDADLL